MRLLPVPGEAGPVRFRLHAEPAAEEVRDPLPLELFHQAQPVPAPPPPGWEAGGLSLASGGAVTVRGRAAAPVEGPGRARLYGFATMRIEIVLDGEPVTLEEGFAIAGPAEVEVR